ncbi:MAG: response regulator [Acidobacteriia bacterium]|nr:response regulator [Terriglobia bacterium]
MKTELLEAPQSTGFAVPVRLLLFQNSPEETAAILRELEQSGIAVQAEVSASAEEFRRSLAERSYDAVLADYSLAEGSGREALQELRDSGKDTPLLLLAAALGDEEAAECIKQGASEYIRKEHLSRLPAALKRALREKALREESELAQAALARNAERLRAIIEAEPHCVKIVDREGVLLEINQAGLQMLEAESAEEVVGKPMCRLIVPEYRDRFLRLQQYICEGGSGVLEFETVGLKGTRLWMESYAVPFRDAGGPISGSLSVTRDISEHKRAEEALRLSEARNRDLVENAAYGICRTSLDGVFQYVNPALLRMLQCASSEEIRALKLAGDVFRYPEEFARLVAACQEQGRISGAESEWRRRDGSIFTVRLALRRVATPSSAESLEIIAEDVTELRAMERQLRHAQKFEAISQLAGGVAHDFNNVVGAILGWAELGCEQTKESPQVALKFLRIREQAERAAALTKELLAFARQQILQPRAVDLNEVVKGLVRFLDKIIGRDIELKVEQASLEPVRADPAQIEQALMDLCLNARDAMPEGGRLVITTEMADLDERYCRFYSYALPGRYAVLSVSDTGMGMDAETRERIFEPFFTTKELGKGTGMGLATVYGIVKQHNGFIQVYSEPGHGSMFRIYLPVLQRTAAEKRESGEVPLSGDVRGGQETILLVEDHDTLREMAHQTLLGLGYRVLPACDGEEALQLCASEAPDLAILDVVMPKLGGIATATKLRKEHPNLPLIYTSGYVSEPGNFVSSGPPAFYLQKPYSPAALARLVRQVLDQAAQAATFPSP